MVSVTTTASKESRVLLMPSKPPKHQPHNTTLTRQTRWYSLQPTSATVIRPMALPNGLSPELSVRRFSSSEDETVGSTVSTSSSPPTPSTIRPVSQARGQDYVVKLSSIEHCMPRAYIRVCLAYKVPTPEAEVQALLRLDNFVRRIVDAKPYLAGWVVSAHDPGPQEGKVEVRFTLDDLNNFPTLQTRRLTHCEVPFDYEKLNQDGLPPSVIKPDLVSALPESADEDRAPVFRVQANLVNGGLIVSFYLHHCISDGTGMGLLISGDILNDNFTFHRKLHSSSHAVPSLDDRLETFAKQKSWVRSALSWSSPNLISERKILYRRHASPDNVSPPPKVAGRGCILTFPDAKLIDLRDSLQSELVTVNPQLELTKTDVLQTLLWHHMTSARRPSLPESEEIQRSKLLTPVNIRKKLDQPLADNYFGAAVDFASTEMSIAHLEKFDRQSMAKTALAIHEAIGKVDDAYVRTAIALSNSPDPTVDVRDLQASNMDRARGADMYITSWKSLRLYSAELDLGLGKPDWVRKPWSKDPGSCIILPKDPTKCSVEVVVQMTEDDMGRLLADMTLMDMVSRVIE